MLNVLSSILGHYDRDSWVDNEISRILNPRNAPYRHPVILVYTIVVSAMQYAHVTACADENIALSPVVTKAIQPSEPALVTYTCTDTVPCISRPPPHTIPTHVISCKPVVENAHRVKCARAKLLRILAGHHRRTSPDLLSLLAVEQLGRYSHDVRQDSYARTLHTTRPQRHTLRHASLAAGELATSR